MRVVQIREAQPEPSLFIETVKTFAAVAVFVGFYVLFAGAF